MFRGGHLSRSGATCQQLGKRHVAPLALRTAIEDAFEKLPPTLRFLSHAKQDPAHYLRCLLTEEQLAQCYLFLEVHPFRTVDFVNRNIEMIRKMNHLTLCQENRRYKGN